MKPDDISGGGFDCFNFPPKYFPIKVEAFRTSNKELVWSKTIERPRGDELQAVAIPPLRKIYGEIVDIKVTFADGSQWSSDSTKIKN